MTRSLDCSWIAGGGKAGNRARVVARAALIASSSGLAGCGGGVPLLHGAHTLLPREVSFGAGFSGTFATGEPSTAALRGQKASQAGPANTPPLDGGDVARSTAVLVAMAPAVAPWVSARFGLGGDNDVGLTYSGRAAQLDVRHAFLNGNFALSAGMGASWVAVVPRDQQPGASDVRLDWDSAGIDIPLLVGWRSTAGIVSLWGGVRAGFERVAGDALLGTPEKRSAVGFDLRRTYAGGVIGLGFGFRHVHGTVELDATYQSLTGTMGNFDARVRGLTLAPAAGLVATF